MLLGAVTPGVRLETQRQVDASARVRLQSETVSINSGTVKPPIGNPPMAEHTADTEQFPWSQYATLTYRRFQLRNNFLLGTKNVVPNPFLVWSFYCSQLRK